MNKAQQQQQLLRSSLASNCLLLIVLITKLTQQLLVYVHDHRLLETFNVSLYEQAWLLFNARQQHSAALLFPECVVLCAAAATIYQRLTVVKFNFPFHRNCAHKSLPTVEANFVGFGSCFVAIFSVQKTTYADKRRIVIVIIWCKQLEKLHAMEFTAALF